MKRTLYVLFALVLASLILLSGFSAFAQSLYITYDFTVSDQGFVPHTFPTVRAVYVAGVGWHKHPDRNDRVTIQLDGANLSNVQMVRVFVNCADVNAATIHNIGGWTCSGGVITGTFGGGVAMTDVFVDLQMDGSDDPYITKIEIYIVGPTATPTFTPSPTLTPSPTTNAPPFARSCILLGNANSNFSAGNVWTLGSGITTPDDSNGGIQFPHGGATAQLPLNLRQTNQYKIEVQYRLQTLPEEELTLQSFTIGLGEQQEMAIPIAISLITQSATLGARNYVPGPDGLFDLTIQRPAVPTEVGDPEFVVDWICVIQTSSSPEPEANGGSDGSTPGGGGSGSGTGSGVQCETCPEYAPQGGFDHLVDDFGQIIGWLWCRIGGVIGCVVVNALSGLWFTIRNILGFLAVIMVWTGRTARGVIEWLHSINVAFWAWLGGSSNNATTIAGNTATAVTNGLSGVTSSASGADGLVQWVSAQFQNAANLISETLGLGQRGLRVYNIFMDALNRGLDPDSPSMLYASSVITASEAVYYLRLGFYVMDNTIFAGPFWYWVGTSQFLVALMVLIWVVNSFKNLLKR